MRDRGYLTLPEIQRHLDAEADCIYRHKTGILYLALETTQWQKHKRRISLLKLVKFLSAAPDNLLRAIKSLSADIEQSDGFHKTLLRYCCYDQRKRRNFSEKWSSLA